MCENGTGVSQLSSIPIEDIHLARKRLKGHVIRTPLVPLNVKGVEVYLKLENLQNTGSFKQRGAGNALLCLDPESCREGVYCPSAGNFAQGVAFMASRLGIPSTIIVPENAPKTKVSAIEKHGGHVMKVPYDTWWQTMVTQHYEGIPGTFVHPVCNKNVIAGNGTIGLEILEDLSDVDIIICPFGGGGCITGIASAVKTLKPSVQIVACEVATAAPLSASRQAGKPTTVTDHQTSFVDGMGGKSVFPEMWSLIGNLIDDVIVLSPGEIAEAVKLVLESNRVLSEGAGAAPVAAAMKMKSEWKGKKIVAVISGGNIDLDKITLIIQGKVPC